MSSSKKLKMERLSPIPVVTRPPSNLSDSSLRCTTPKASLRKRKDCYAIESTSSPEVEMHATSSQKFKKTRNSIVRNRNKTVSKKHASTPLSGLIARKTVSLPSRELATASDSQASSGQSPAGHSDYISQFHIEGLQTIDEEIDQKHQICVFNSPLKRKILNPSRHSEIFTPSMVFPPVQTSNPSNHTPLSGIVTKTSVGHNRSLNDSINILLNPDVEMCEDAIMPDEPGVVLPSIECFESPGKLPPAKYVAKVSFDRSNIVLRDHISKPRITSKFNTSVEMSGSERKKRKRALDFQTFPVTESESPANDMISPDSPILRSKFSGESGSVHNIKPHLSIPKSELPIPQIDDDFQTFQPVAESACPANDMISPVSPILRSKFSGESGSVHNIKPQLSIPKSELPIPQIDDDFQAFPVEPESSKDDMISPILMSKFLGDSGSVHNIKPQLSIPKSELPIPQIDDDSQALPVEPESPKDDMISPVSPILMPKFSIHNSKEDLKQQLGIPEFELPHPHVDVIFDDESVIEGTPKSCQVSNVVKDDSLSGFTACSSLAFDAEMSPFKNKDFAPIIDHDSPPGAAQPKLEIVEEASNDGFSGLKFDLNVVHQDQSSDESEVGYSVNRITIQNVPDVQAKSQPLNFNCTRREIRPCESPCKTTKPFSEAVNIGAFGSPNSNASDYEPEQVVDEKEEEDDINVTSSLNDDEFVEESEQIRPNKRRKKGSLLERCGFIISRIDASNSLFDYEMKAGLRPSSGKFVSSQLVVCKKWDVENAHFLVCKSLKYCKMDSQRQIDVAGRTSMVVIMANKIPKELSEGSVVLLHCPTTIVYCHSLGLPCVLAGNQLVLDSNFQKFSDSRALEIDDALIDVLNRPMKIVKNQRSPSSMKVFPFCSIKSLADASLSQCLIDEFELSLRVLHVVRNHSDSTLKTISVLCADSEEHYCWIRFTEERDVKRATALEALHILADGVLILVRGFHVLDRSILDKKTKNLLNYALNGTVKSDLIFSLTPVEMSWVVSLSGEPRDAKKSPNSIDNILQQKVRGKRFLIGVTSTKFDQDQNIFLTDSLGNSVAFIQGEQAPKMRFELLSGPFFLDAIYYYDGKIFSDEFTKLIPDKLPWAV